MGKHLAKHQRVPDYLQRERQKADTWRKEERE
jgi:hypothetical protein